MLKYTRKLFYISATCHQKELLWNHQMSPTQQSLQKLGQKTISSFETSDEFTE